MKNFKNGKKLCDQMINYMKRSWAERESQIPQSKKSRISSKKSRISYFTPLEKKIYDALYALTEKIQSETTRSQEFASIKEQLRIIKQQILGKRSHNLSLCEKTSFLEFLVRLETEKLSNKEAETYKSFVSEIWTQYMRSNFLPYLSGPIFILKNKHFENDDQELAAIMTFVKYQWDVLYDQCTYGEEQYNMIGFIMGQNECNCTCITALLLVTADCLGLFPEFILGQRNIEHIFVVTHRAMVIEAAGTPASTIVDDDEPRGPIVNPIRTPKEFFDAVSGWYTPGWKIRQMKTKKLMATLDEPDSDFEKAMQIHFSKPNLTDPDFVLKWLEEFADWSDIKEYVGNPDFMRLYYEYLLLYHQYHNTHLFQHNKITSQIPMELMTDTSNQTRKYRMLFLVTVLYFDKGEDYYDNYDFQTNKFGNEELDLNERIDINIWHPFNLLKGFAHELISQVDKVCVTFTSDPTDVLVENLFKKEAYKNLTYIAQLWRRINKFAPKTSIKIPTTYILNLEKQINSCF